MDLSPTERRLYDILHKKSGIVVAYREFDRVLSGRNGSSNLRVVISRMRRRYGLTIETVFRSGYRLKPERRPPMPVIELDMETQFYAQDVQDAIHGAMRKHAENVGFEAQVAIIGVAIGAILNQIPEPDRSHFVKILMKNVRKAPQMSELVRVQ